MRVAILGDGCPVNSLKIEELLPEETHMIIAGGGKGIDQQVASYALAHEIALVDVMPDVRRFGDHANLVRNSKMIELADYVVAIWDGKSRDTELTLELANELYKPIGEHKIG